MNRYFWIFLDSIRGFRSYVRLYRNSIWTTLLYWFGICLVISLVVVGVGYKKYSEVLPEYCDKVSRNLPSFAFKNGELSVSGETPSISNTNVFPIVLDPDGKMRKPLPAFTNGMFHIGRTKISVWKQPENPSLMMSIAQFPDGEVNRDYIYNQGRRLGYLIAPFMVVVLALIYSVVGLLQALFFASLVSFLERAIRPTFTFEEILNISIYALTPAALIVTVYWLWGVRVLPYDLIYFFTYLIFHVLASGACRRTLLPPSEEE